MSGRLEILDEHFTFMRVHKVNIIAGETHPRKKIRLSAFDPKGINLSVDWAEKCTALETQQRAVKNPENNGVIQMLASGVRNGDNALELQHSPTNNNFAHSEIIGVPPKRATDVGARAKLLAICEWVIECEI